MTEEQGKKKSMKGGYNWLWVLKLGKDYLHMTWKDFTIHAQEVEFINSHERNTGNYINANTWECFTFFLDLFRYFYTE